METGKRHSVVLDDGGGASRVSVSINNEGDLQAARLMSSGI